MTYLVHGPDGVTYGPADLATLQAWAREGRVSPETWLLEQPTGREVRAADLPELGAFWPALPVSAPPCPHCGLPLAPGVRFCPRCGFRDMAGQTELPPQRLLTGVSLWDYTLGLVPTLLLLLSPALGALFLPGSATLPGAMLWLVVLAVPTTVAWVLLRPFPKLKRGIGAGLLAALCSLPLLVLLGVVSAVQSFFSTPWKPCNYP